MGTPRNGVIKITTFIGDEVIDVERKKWASNYPWVAEQLFTEHDIEGHYHPVSCIEVHYAPIGKVRYERDSHGAP